MGEVQQMIFNQGETKGAAKTISVLIKNGFPIEEIKRMYSSEYSPEDLQEVLSQAQLLAA